MIQNMIKTIQHPTFQSSCTLLITEETNKLKFGLLHSFVDKNKHVQKHSAVNFGSLVGKITDNLDCSK